MGICTSAGIIRDFAGPYYVSEDQMGFDNPTMYWQLNPKNRVAATWDSAVHQASEEYSHRMHNLFCMYRYMYVHVHVLYMYKITNVQLSFWEKA
ncbi:PREDICTED: transmembrane protein 222-like [Amphimedon queenslandica]|uniref:Uncharacterized protein n=1 Tax=Amphimedon queenslandica TaxID=400682 RepID=A0AAN0JSB7_AMPQE|nr:PREDICTED: transmembrane protein 222-like [Amphimedon queenslandica]|eukprot:XP_019859771.1 PREDICTED: transmembrane protein 222-like [Amphimedon queenslandica]